MARIGFDTRLYAYRRGGIPQYAAQLSRALVPALAKRGHTSLIYHAPRILPTLPESASLHTPTLWTPPHFKLEQLTLPLEMRRTHPDLVHSPDFIPPRLGKWKRVITVHDLDFLRQPHRLSVEARKYYWQIHWAVAEADAIIAVSEATKRDLGTLLGVPAERVTVIYEAADPRFRPADPLFGTLPHPENAPKPGRYFLTVGTIEPRKNLDMLLSAYRKYRSSTRGARSLVVVGQEGWNSEKTMERLRTTEGVHWLPDIELSPLLALYQNATAVLQPAWDEGFGLPIVEAMSCGTPVAISNAAALTEIAAGAALEAPADDINAWSLVMETLSELPEVRQDFAARGRARAAAFSWETAARETADLYDRVLDPARSRPQAALSNETPNVTAGHPRA